MAKEIERKFLVDIEKWGRTGKTIHMEQAYIAVEGCKVVRVRIAGEKAFLTIKGNLKGITRDEFEYEIPVSDARQMMQMSVGFTVKKIRYIEEIDGKIWEIDVFKEKNAGLVVAEIELESEEECFTKPEWLLDEVSTDEKYFNFNLALVPYSKW